MVDDLLHPAYFLAHGSPMLALEGGAWGEALAELGRGLPTVRAVLVISAHWETRDGFRVTAAAQPGILHDFGGFPASLYQVSYPAPGLPSLAEEVLRRLSVAGLTAEPDAERPLDHGAWVPLRYLAPSAATPVIQVSLPRPRTPQLLLQAGRALATLRSEGVLILGSGGVVHNLGRLDWDESSPPKDWAQAFDDWVANQVSRGDEEALLDWRHAPGAGQAVPTTEHLDPLFVVAGAASGPGEPVFRGWQLGSLSLSSYRFQAPPRALHSATRAV